jgi:hypothetical protein
MFNMSWTTPHKGEIRAIRLTYNPIKIMHPFGPLTDADGNVWDMRGIQGSKDGILLLLRPCSNDDLWWDTSHNANPSGWRTWVPYRVEVIEKEDV